MMEKPGLMKILDKHTIALAVVVIANLIEAWS
jgi:hypothetical protein